MLCIWGSWIQSWGGGPWGRGQWLEGAPTLSVSLCPPAFSLAFFSCFLFKTVKY